MKDSREKVIIKKGKKWTEKQLKRYRNWQKKYIKENYRTFVFRLNYEKEKDLIDFIKSQPNITNCVREALISEMNSSK